MLLIVARGRNPVFLEFMNASFLSEDIVSGILEDSMPFTFSLGEVLSSNDFSDIRLNDAATSMIDSVNSSLFNGGATFFFLGFRRGPI